MKNFKKEMDGINFHVRQRETYSFNDVIEIVEQHAAAINSNLGRKFEDEFTNYESQIAELKSKEGTQVSEVKTELEKALEAKTGFESQIEKLNKEIETSKGKIKNFQIKEDKAVATSLLGGMVAGGAEYDVMSLLKPQIEDLHFGDEMKVEEKQKALEPIVKGLIETKPYFAPTTENKSDNKSLIKKEVGKDDEGDKKESEFTGNVLRRNPEA